MLTRRLGCLSSRLLSKKGVHLAENVIPELGVNVAFQWDEAGTTN